MHIVYMVVNGLLTAAVVFYAVRAAWSADEAEEAHKRTSREAGKLNAMAGRVIALESALESLAAQHRKLSGRFHAEKYQRETAEVFEDPPSAQPIMCDNWRMAQVEGPQSEFAKCACEYCQQRRYARDQLRLDLQRSSFADKVKAVSRGKE
jgi:hypothetical protein